jgi:serine/threonine protein kinase
MTENGKERVGDYELMELIGDGAQGRVYKAQYLGEDVSKVAHGEIVAIKLIRITGDDDKLRTKFQAQADILRRLSHTNIVRYRDSFAWHAGEWDEAQCLVMEFLEGETLTDRLKKANTGLPWPQVEEVFEQCLAGLIHARERGITHRDIKPSNIFITKDGLAKVIDFDIARKDDSGQMSTAGWKGTFDYMAPDFITIQGFRGDEVSDIFSLGVCFYQALTGGLPFEPLGDSAHIGYLNRWRDGASPSPSFRPGVFRVLSNAKPFVAKCVAPKRDHRYQTFAAMLEDFRKIRSRRIRHKNRDEYELLAVLGRGGFGEVFKARKLSDGSLVAVKHLFAEKQSDRFIKEAKILQQYPHPNLCKYVDFMVVEGTGGEKQYFLILEFLEGMPGWTLRTRLKNEGRLDSAEAIPLFIGYLAALQFLHENSRPIIHRDIKPGNLYAPAGQPEKGKIFDLGVARDVSGTVTVGGVPGTLDYMPPEFADTAGDRGSPQSDIYALGLCLYESLAGRPVYDRLPTDMNSAWLAFQQRLRKALELSFEGEAFRQYPRLKSVIMKALAPRPVDRYRSAAEMKKDLENVLAGTGYGDAHDDESVAEMTIATLHSFADDSLQHPPEPGATMGTRPLDGVGGTMPAPIDLLAAGKAVADRRQRQKRMMVVGGIAAAVILAIGGAAWVVSGISSRNAAAISAKMTTAIQEIEQAAGDLKTAVPTAAYARSLSQAYAKAVKTGETYPELSDRVDEQRRLMRKSGAALPAEFKRGFDAALAADKPDKADALLKEWQETEKFTDIMGLDAQRYAEQRDSMKAAITRAEIEHDLAALMQSFPPSVEDEGSLTKAETAAAKLKELRDRAWAGFDDAEKQQRLGTLATTLSERVFPHIAQLRDSALGKYRSGQDGEADRNALLAFASRYPALTWIVQAAFLDAKNSVEAARQSRFASGGLSKVMDRAANARDSEAVVAAAGELIALEGDPDVKLLPAQIKAAEQAIAAKYLFFAQGYAQQAGAAYDAGQMAEGQKAQKVLSDLAASVPDRFGKKALAGLEKDVAGRRAAMEAKQAEAAADRNRHLQDAGKALADLSARIRKGDLRDCTDGVLVLAGNTATALADPQFKAQREAVVADYAKLVEKTLAQKDPLDQRAARVKAADEVLNASSADVVFASRIKALRDSLSDQKVGFILRLTNQSGQPLKVSGQELKDRVTLDKGATRDIELPVRSANVASSLLIEGDAGSKPRIESVMLVGAGGRELVLTALEKVEVVVPPVATAGETPARPVSAAVSAGKGVLQISIVPRLATLTVDGNIVRAGSVEVTADQNHKIQVESPGYKTCLQYYRVKSGETRKIEIFLEKSAKKSFFGL